MKAGRCRHRERRRISRPVAPAEHPPKQTTGRWCDQGTSSGPMTRSEKGFIGRVSAQFTHPLHGHPS